MYFSTLIILGLFGLIIQAIKNVLNFPRPGGIEGIDINFLNPVVVYSYPSGHALHFIFWHLVEPSCNEINSINKIFNILFNFHNLPFPELCKAHWLSDVIASYAFTLLLEIIHKEKVINFLNKSNYQISRQH